MAGEQYLAFYKQTARDTAPGSPVFKFLPILSGWPKFKAVDEPRKEFAGQSTALGARTVVRKEQAFTAAPQFYYRPGEETGMFLRQLLGYMGARATVDTLGKKGIMYPVPTPWGSDAPLGDEALGLVANLDEGGTTKSQAFNGFRPATATFAFKGTDDVTLTVEGGGAWIGAADQTATAGVSMPSVDPFNSSEVAFYIGTGITRSGTAPNFTDIIPGSMTRFYPDSLTLKITNGITDKVVANGVKGPSKSNRSAQFTAEVDFDIDYEDPAGGFSSADEVKRLFSGPANNSILIVMTHSTLAGSTTEKYKTVIDLPWMNLNADRAEPDNEGKTPSQKFSYKSLNDPTIGYPVAIVTTDRSATY